MRATAVPIIIFAFAALGCAADAPDVTAPVAGVARPDHAPAVTTMAERWNAVTRAIVSRREFGPLGIARTFALVSVAQYDAVIAAEKAKLKSERHADNDDERGSDRARASRATQVGASATAGAAVLTALYPAEASFIAAQLADDRATATATGSRSVREFDAGATIGNAIASAVLARAATDGSTAVWTGTAPVGRGYWYSAPAPARPLSPLWGTVRPWLMTSGDQFRPPPPPAFGSTEFNASLAEVRSFTDNRTPEQLAIAQYWGNTAGTAGPAGYFSERGLALATSYRYDERRMARMLATMHMAGMDASIGCWDAKYFYWYLRPYQADAAITTPVGRPNFPSYPSAHSCFSATYAGVLEGLFPSAADGLRATVAEAGVSRIYAGLHYRFDVSAGQRLGAQVAALALKRMPRGHRPIPLD